MSTTLRCYCRRRSAVFVAVTLILSLMGLAAAQATDPGDAAAMRALALCFPTSNETLGWDPAADPCSRWTSVLCSGGRVTAIHAANRSLSGVLPAEIGNLTALVRLELNYNRITGVVPSLSGLSSLQFLFLQSNLFSAISPDFFSGLTSLRSVYLDSNPFDPWPFPDSIQSCASLVNFSANFANISGELPDFIGTAFPMLSYLGLSYNLLHGSIPMSFASSSVQSLWLNNQNGVSRMSGGIDVVENMTSLTQLWLQSNSFSGTLPNFSALAALRDLNLRDNQFTGPVPSSILSLPLLNRLCLTNNMLQGAVPVFPSNVKFLDLTVSSESFCLPSPGKCDRRVSALLSIVKNFGYPSTFARSWKGNDPCASWIGISCDVWGNITVINFQSMGLNGTISPDFKLLPSLQRVLLSNNKITGRIPTDLNTIASLKQLDVSNNSLFGPVPKFATTTAVITTGNPNINEDDSGSSSGPGSGGGLSNSSSSGSGPSGHSAPSLSWTPSSHSRTARVISGLVIECVLIPLVIGLLGLFYYKKKQRSFGRFQSSNSTVIHPGSSWSDPEMLKMSNAQSSVNGGASVSDNHSQVSAGTSETQVAFDSGNMLISIQMLRDVTNNFSEDNVLGRGGFGSVYKGELHDGTKIAVKRMESGVMGTKGLEEFKSEIAVLTKVRHRNLVSLLGYCLDGNERILVYEYMPQGALSRHLFDWRAQGLLPLEWKKRLSIALDVARGVEYLHSLAHQSFIHRDLKPSNILIGDDMKAKVADFGLVRLAPDDKCSSLETRLAGTFGYLAPEYAVTGRVTTRSDVFSFGVILMELITGRKALDESQPEESIHLVTWFRRIQPNKDTFNTAIDATILSGDEETLASITTVSELAGHCCARDPGQRPDMGHAVNVLSSLLELWKPSIFEPDDSCYTIDFDLSLPQVLKKWQAFAGDGSHVHRGNSSVTSFLESSGSTQTSLPNRPPGFADSFTSVDGR